MTTFCLTSSRGGNRSTDELPEVKVESLDLRLMRVEARTLGATLVDR